jgi:hypothetical protein
MSDPNTLSRRSALRFIGIGGLAGLAGCSSESSDNSNTISSSNSSNQTTGKGKNDIIQSVEPDGYNLQVTLAEGTPVGSVGLIGPNGNSVSESDVQAGETQTSLSLGGYTPGTNEVVAARDGSVVDRYEIDLQPDFEIAQIAHASSNRDEIPDLDLGDTFNDGIPHDHTFLVIENTGDITIRIADVKFVDSRRSEGGFKPDIGLRNNNGANPRTIEPGSSYAYSSQDRVLVNEDKYNCESAEGELTVTVTTESGVAFSETYAYVRTDEQVIELLGGPVCRTTYEDNSS